MPATFTDKRRVTRLVPPGPLPPPGLTIKRAVRPEHVPTPPPKTAGPEVMVAPPPLAPAVALPKRGAAPIPVRTPLSEPNAPTTTLPLARVTGSVAAREARKFPRLPSLGDAVPFQGRARLVEGRLGGSPGGFPGLLSELQGRLARVNAAGGVKSAPRELRQVVRDARRRVKGKVRLRAGEGGLDHARGTSPLSSPFWKRAELRDIRGRALRDSPAALRQVPEAEVVELEATRALVPLGMSAATPLPIGEEDALVGSSGAPVPASAVSGAGAAAAGGGFERVLFLGAAVFIGWMLLKRAG